MRAGAGGGRRRRIASAGISLIATLVIAACSSTSAGSTSPANDFATALRLQRAGQLAQAAEIYTKVVKAQPSNYLAQFNLGVIAQRRRDAGAALLAYRAALAIRPNFAPALYNSATLVAPSDPATAMTLYRRLISLRPAAPTSHLNLGLLEVQNKEPKQGVHDLAAAIKERPALLQRVPKDLRTLVSRLAQLPGKHGKARPTATS